LNKATTDSLSINPSLSIFPLSCRTGEGIDAWYGWLRENVSRH
jgi:hydrogenase nickel incorporation protein HypB